MTNGRLVHLSTHLGEGWGAGAGEGAGEGSSHDRLLHMGAVLGAHRVVAVVDGLDRHHRRDVDAQEGGARRRRCHGHKGGQ